MNTDRPPIPTYWSGEQALEVVDFLDQIINHIWWVHGKKMTGAAHSLPGQDIPPGEAPSEPPPPDSF
jgi:hypothetical protein